MCFVRGFDGLIDCLMRELPEGVVSYNTPVRCIHWSDGREAGDTHTYTHPVRVECINGDMFPADHVIVTLPLGMYAYTFTHTTHTHTHTV